VSDGADTATDTIRPPARPPRLAAHWERRPSRGVLSGGIDSSAITAFASKQYSGRLKTLRSGSTSSRVRRASKGEIRRRTVRTEHHELHLTGAAMPRVIERLVRCHDEPFSDAANIPLFCSVSSSRDRSSRPAGDGGDEMFGGYRRYNIVLTNGCGDSLRKPPSAYERLLQLTPSPIGRPVLQGDGAPRPGPPIALLLTSERSENPPTRSSPSRPREGRAI